MLISKIQTYFCNNMHLKELFQKHAKLGLSPEMAGTFGITFYRCILSLR
jgi:hypothetical protein